jgi:hypothetical protein
MTAYISVWPPTDERKYFTWSVLVQPGPRRPYLAQMRPPCWREYKTWEGALRAARHTVGRLLPAAEQQIPEKPEWLKVAKLFP